MVEKKKSSSLCRKTIEVPGIHHASIWKGMYLLIFMRHFSVISRVVARSDINIEG
jgi:hypothetical protein